MARKYTQEELDYIAENNGIISVETMARNLGRSEWSIRKKRVQLGTGPFLDGGDYITVNQLHKTIYDGRKMKVPRFKCWMDHGFPAFKKRVNKCSFYVIRIDDFWKWAETNKSLVDFRALEENDLGMEPEWLNEKRRDDMKRAKRTEWTNSEDYMLQQYVNRKLPVYEIAKKLNRSLDAIYTRMYILGLSCRNSSHRDLYRKWNDESIGRLCDLIRQGYSIKDISIMTECNRSSIRYALNKKYGTANVETIKEMLNEANKGTKG